MKPIATRVALTLFLAGSFTSGAQVNSVRVASAVMKREIPATVVIPDACAAEPARKFPTLYLLHGAGDNERGWLDRSPVREMADTYGVIIVTPSTGNSWYFDSPVDPGSQFETFVAAELVTFVDTHYSTIAKRTARALAGNSMGGHGAMFLGIRHRDTFSASASMSGGVDIRASDPQVGAFPENWDIKKRLGPIQENPARWNDLTVMNLVAGLKTGELVISIDCGNKDFFLTTNRQLHSKLDAMGIAHQYAEYPGGHSWDYWKLALPRQMAFLGAHLEGATVPKSRLGDADFPKPTPSARHDQKVAAVRSGDYDLVLVGDSITQTVGEMDGEWTPLKTVWDKHFAPRRALNLGYSGYRTENILWNLQHGELDFARSPKVFTLLIGTNNTDDQHYKTVHTAEQVFAGTKAIVDLIRQRHPSTKILVLRIFPCGGPDSKTPYHRKYNRSAALEKTYLRAGELTARLADGKQVFWLDVNPVFLRPDGSINTDLMPDLIHPNAAGAEAWAQAIEPTLMKLLGSQPITDKPPASIIPAP
jgi:S-formylglutathione hydrolase FrmB/lysophospholipase L1-like esterase